MLMINSSVVQLVSKCFNVQNIKQKMTAINLFSKLLDNKLVNVVRKSLFFTITTSKHFQQQSERKCVGRESRWQVLLDRQIFKLKTNLTKCNRHKCSDC